MKITIEERVFHFKQPAGTSRGVYTERKSWMVKVRERGSIGVGECAPLPDLSCDYSSDYGETLRRFCHETERAGKVDAEALRDYPSMLFGLETAFRGLAAPPVTGRETRLFDTPFARGETGIPINGLVWMGSYEQMLQRMEQKLEQGYRCVKLKIGAIGFEQELELVRHIRHQFSRREVELRLDANGAFSPDEALYKLELLSQYGVQSIEQPVKAGQWGLMAELCRESPLPIALDEELIGVNDPDRKSHMLGIIKPAYIVLKPSLHGGMAGTREWVAAAAARGIGSWITSALESNVGLNAIAQFCSEVYGPEIRQPQGLGTGLLFTDNIPMGLEIRGDRLWKVGNPCLDGEGKRNMTES